MKDPHSGHVGSIGTGLAKKALEMIRDIADRGASSWDPAVVGYTLQELSQVLYERTGAEDRVFDPVPAHQICDLRTLIEELEWVDSFLGEMCSSSRCH